MARLKIAERTPTRQEIDQTSGNRILVFGASWCGYCRRFLSWGEPLLQRHPEWEAVWIEDGPGQPLGRSFQVKLWPTLVFLEDGAVRARLVRPELAEVEEALCADSAIRSLEEGAKGTE